MRDLKKVSLWFLAFTTIVMILFNGYEFIVKDKEPPVITCPDQEIKTSVSVTEEELLKGVTVKDNKSKNASDSVVIEKMSTLDENNSRIITYAAIDNAGNVGRKDRTLVYTDYTAPVFEISEPLRFPIGKIPENLMANVTATSSIDGDISEKIKFQFLNNQYMNEVGDMDVEIRVTDSAGVSSVLPVQIELYDEKEENIIVELQQYIVYLTVDSEFDPKSYFKESSIEGNLTVDSNVNTSVAGTYKADYIVNDNDNTGKTRLIVVVE